MSKDADPEILRWTEALRQASLRLKVADLGGTGDDQAFEESFSNLAHAYLRNKASMLEPYELGFQVLDRSDDGERAVAITAFQVGKQLLYAPIFWLRGKIKGHELLYVSASSIFVPLSERWINYMLRQKPPEIGETVTRQRSPLGIRQPDLLRQGRSPFKTAAWDAWGKEAKDKAYEISRSRPDGLLTLPDFINITGRRGATLFAKLAEACPEWAEAAERHHGDALINAIRKAAEEAPDPGNDEKPAEVGGYYTREELTRGTFKTKETEKDLDDEEDQAPDVLSLSDPRKLIQILTYQFALNATLPADVTDEEREQLVAQGVAIRDKRTDDEVSRVYSEDPGVEVSNPTESGLYDVITRKDGIQKCLVILKPWTSGGSRSGAIVINMENDARRYTYVAPGSVWVTKRYEADECAKIVDALPKAKDGLTTGDSYHQRIMLIDRRRLEGTIPLRIPEKVRNEDGIAVYEMYSHDCIRRPGRDRNDDAYPNCGDFNGQLVIDNSEGTRFRATSSDLWASAGARVMRVSNEGYFELGTVRDLKSQMYTSLHKLSVYRNGNEVVLASNQKQSQAVSPLTALTHLVRSHGMRADVARNLLKVAELERKATVFVKYANPYLQDVQQFGPMYDLPDNSQSFDTAAGESYGMEPSQEMTSPVEMPQEEPRESDPLHYVDQNVLSRLQNASQLGQQDVFDAESLKTMLRNMRDDQLMDRFLPPLAKALDATGRLLFQFYWHQEDFEDRYGSADMPELEDGLRNLFEGLGDIVLKLKEHTVDAYGDGEQLSSTLTDIAGAS